MTISNKVTTSKGNYMKLFVMFHKSSIKTIPRTICKHTMALVSQIKILAKTYLRRDFKKWMFKWKKKEKSSLSHVYIQKTTERKRNSNFGYWKRRTSSLRKKLMSYSFVFVRWKCKLINWNSGPFNILTWNNSMTKLWISSKLSLSLIIIF